GTGKEVQTFRGHKDWVTSVNFSKDGFYVVSSGVDKLIKISEVTTRDTTLAAEQSGNLLALAVSPDGKLIASGGTDSTIKIWDRKTGSDLATLIGHADVVTALTFSADSKRLVSGSLDCTIKAWDVATAKELPRQPEQQQNWTTLDNAPPLVAVAPDGKKLFVWEPRKKTTKVGIYDLVSGKDLGQVEDSGRDVRAVTFSTD